MLRGFKFFQMKITNNYYGHIHFQAAPEKTVVILHGCCHNPTGTNPSEEQLKEIADLAEVCRLYMYYI